MKVLRSAAANAAYQDPSNQVLQKFLASARECVLVVNSQMRIAHYNRPAAAVFGSELRDLDSRRVSEVIRDIEIHDAFRAAIEAGVVRDFRLETAPPEKRRFDVHVAPIELHGENCAIGFFYETTRIDRLETVRQEFLSNISHELRTPLTSILAFVETLEDGGIDDKENNLRFLNVIRRNAERMHSLISDILELSLIESGNVAVVPTTVRLANSVNEAVIALEAMAAENEVEVFIDIADDVIVEADPVRLGQMLINLLDNAIKFNRRGGTVTISAVDRHDRVVVEVADTGEGIMPEHIGRIFERLYRADRSRARDIGGTGLGLAIVKHLARLHGGEVNVTSIPGSGTTFRFDLARRVGNA